MHTREVYKEQNIEEERFTDTIWTHVVSETCLFGFISLLGSLPDSGSNHTAKRKYS